MKPFAWSYSALTRFETCPKQYYEINVTKNFKDEDSPEAAEGKKIHQALYERVVNDKALPIPMRHMEPMARKFADMEMTKNGEMKLALTRDFEPTDWFAKDVYVRSIADLLLHKENIGVVVDWKTGKVKPDETQLGLSVAVLAKWMPELDFFKAAYVWVAHKQVTRYTYTLSKLTNIWNLVLPRAQKMEQAYVDIKFPAKPSGLCKGYCPVKTCEHWKEKGSRSD